MKVLVYAGALTQDHKRKINDTAASVNAQVVYVDSVEEITEEHLDAEAVYGFGFNIMSAEKLRESKNLKWLSVTSAGVDFLMKPGLFANEDLIITNSAGAYGVSIAEHIIAVSLMMMRKLTYHYASSIEGVWAPPVMQRSLKDSRITVWGTGDIGSSFAKRAKAFEPACIIGVSRSGIRKDPVYDSMITSAEIDEILTKTDLLVMSLPGTAETNGILSRERLNLLPQGAYVVNVGRGNAIDEEALADCLEEGRIAGAALDVFRTEPLPKDSRLWKTKNLLITPHVAGNLTLPYTVDKNVEMFCENLVAYANGQPLKHVVDRAVGY